MFSAVRDRDVHFHQIDRHTGARIRNKKVSEQSGQEVADDDIEMGFELSPGKYVTFDKQELNALKPASTRAIEVTDFVDLKEIDPIFYERTYWLAPVGDEAAEPYALLLAAMSERSRVALGTVVIRNKQHLTAIRPLDGALALSTMRFEDEVVPSGDIEGLPARLPKPNERTMKMAVQLLDGMSSDWDPSGFRDTFAAELRKRISEKERDGVLRTEKSTPLESPSSDTALDLMAELEASVAAMRDRRPSKVAPRRHQRKSA